MKGLYLRGDIFQKAPLEVKFILFDTDITIAL